MAYAYAYATSQMREFVIIDTDSLAHAKAIASLHLKRSGAMSVFLAEVDTNWPDAAFGFIPCFARWHRAAGKEWQDNGSMHEARMRRFEKNPNSLSMLIEEEETQDENR